MFGSSKSNKKDMSKSKSTVSKPTSSGSGLNSLVDGTVVEGTVQSAGDIRVDGAIKGKLNCSAKVIIGPTGKVSGEINCKNAVIEGNFDGNLQVDELLNIRETAKVEGEISTGKLIVQSGAVFNVSCVMGGKKTNIGSLVNKPSSTPSKSDKSDSKS